MNHSPFKTIFGLLRDVVMNTVTYLLRSGVAATVVDECGRKPVFYSRLYGHEKVTVILEDHEHGLPIGDVKRISMMPPFGTVRLDRRRTRAVMMLLALMTTMTMMTMITIEIE